MLLATADNKTLLSVWQSGPSGPFRTLIKAERGLGWEPNMKVDSYQDVIRCKLSDFNKPSNSTHIDSKNRKEF